jgi:O-antigen/teichoic acid export membrane protein
MIRNMLGDVALGNFSAAVKLSESYYFIPGVILSALFPAIVYGKSHSEAEYKRRVQKLFDLLTLCSLPVAIIISLFADPLTHALYGPKYTHVGAVLSLHIWAGVFVFWGVAMGKLLVIEKMPQFVTLSTALGFIVNLGLNLVLINKYNVIGAAIATLAAQSVSVLFSLLIMRKTRPYFWMIMNTLNPIQMTKYITGVIKRKEFS